MIWSVRREAAPSNPSTEETLDAYSNEDEQTPPS
jgi:hypothetical protein